MNDRHGPATGRILASVSDDKTLRLWALPDGTPIGVLRPPIGDREEGELYAVALTGSVLCPRWALDRRRHP